MLAHKAEEEGIAFAEHLVTGFGHVNYDAIPAVVYTQPEIASVGQSEEGLQALQVDYRKGVFPFRANGRAHALGHVEGKIKMLADAKTDRILGVHILGPRAGDLIAEAAVAIELWRRQRRYARRAMRTRLSPKRPRSRAAVDKRTIHINGPPVWFMKTDDSEKHQRSVYGHDHLHSLGLRSDALIYFARSPVSHTISRCFFCLTIVGFVAGATPDGCFGTVRRLEERAKD